MNVPKSLAASSQSLIIHQQAVQTAHLAGAARAHGALTALGSGPCRDKVRDNRSLPLEEGVGRCSEEQKAGDALAVREA